MVVEERGGDGESVIKAEVGRAAGVGRGGEMTGWGGGGEGNEPRRPRPRGWWWWWWACGARGGWLSLPLPLPPRGLSRGGAVVVVVGGAAQRGSGGTARRRGIVGARREMERRAAWAWAWACAVSDRGWGGGGLVGGWTSLSASAFRFRRADAVRCDAPPVAFSNGE